MMKTRFVACLIGLPFISLAGLGMCSLPHTTNRAEAKREDKVLPRHGGTLAHFDFSDAAAWLEKSATVTAAPVGTVDVAGGTEASGGLLFAVQGSKSASVGFVSGLLPLQNGEANLGKLTLSFSLSATSTQPVTVQVESFDAARHRTGGLTGTIYPAAPDCYQRYALDLSTLKPVGTGKFQPTAPFVQFRFAPEGAASDYQIRLDNVNYATPAYYVSPKGSDQNDGRTEQTAFAAPQKALDLAQPGDIVLLMEGTYNGKAGNVASFRRPGTPDAWIVLKNYPGQKPLLTCNGWNTVSIALGSKERPYDGPALAYLEVRGLHVRGEGDVAKNKYSEAMNKPDPRTNTNGIAIDGRYSKNVFHHLRLADNLVEFCPGCGIGSINGDWVTVENNICHSNSWTTIYATSGISVMGFPNFDATDNVYKRLVRNNICYRNETFEIWQAVHRVSDGNGIILDVNRGPDPNGGAVVAPASRYIGRTLVQSNLCFDNGGSGIHTVNADRVDIINNTAYLNSASKALQYSEIYTYASDDVRIVNNILVAPVADVAAGEKPEPVNRLGGKNGRVVFSHNLYYGGNIAPTLGEGDVVADPRFVKPSRDGKVADFHLRPDSPAIGKGIPMAFAPFLDLDGKPHKNPPSEGAYRL